MAAILGILTTLAVLIFWIGRAAQGAHHITDAAETLVNLPRKLRYKKRVGRSGLDLIEDAREAAAVLMVATARLSGDGRVSAVENDAIEEIVRDKLGWPEEDAEDFVLNIRWLTRDYKQPDSVLRPMINFLQKSVSTQEASDLRDMMETIAKINGPASPQTDFIRRYNDGLNLAKRDAQ